MSNGTRIQFQSLVRRSQAQKEVATLRAKQSEIIERKLQAQAALVFQNCLRRKLARICYSRNALFEMIEYWPRRRPKRRRRNFRDWPRRPKFSG